MHHVVLRGSLWDSVTLCSLALPSLCCKHASGREAVAIKRVGLCNDVDNDGGVLGQECFIVYFLPFKHLVHLREGATPICNLLSRHYLAGRRLHCASLDRLADHFSIGVELDAGESKVLQVEPSDKVEEPVYR